MRRERVERLRILVADDEESVRKALAGMCESLGHQVIAQARNGEEAVSLVYEACPDLVLLDIRMPTMAGLEAARTISRHVSVPILIVTAHTDDGFIEEAAEAGVFNYLVKPITGERLGAAISTARARFKDFCHLQQELGDAKQALEARKLIERAKGILMRDMRIGEQEAHRWLKRASSHHNLKLAEVARRVVALDRPGVGPGARAR